MATKENNSSIWYDNMLVRGAGIATVMDGVSAVTDHMSGLMPGFTLQEHAAIAAPFSIAIGCTVMLLEWALKNNYAQSLVTRFALGGVAATGSIVASKEAEGMLRNYFENQHKNPPMSAPAKAAIEDNRTDIACRVTLANGQQSNFISQPGA